MTWILTIITFFERTKQNKTKTPAHVVRRCFQLFRGPILEYFILASLARPIFETTEFHSFFFSALPGWIDF